MPKHRSPCPAHHVQRRFFAHPSCRCRFLQHIKFAHQCFVRGLRFCSCPCLCFTVLCQTILQHMLSTQLRVKYTRRCACGAVGSLSFGSDGVQTNCANKAVDHLLFSGLRVTVRASCLAAGVSATCSSINGILPIQSPFSHLLGNVWFQPCTWNRTVSRSTSIAPPHSRPRGFLYGVNPSSNMVYLVRRQPQCRTLHCTRRELGLRVSFGTVSPAATQVRSKPCTGWCAFSTSPLDLACRHNRFSPVSPSSTAVIKACSASSPSATSTVLCNLPRLPALADDLDWSFRCQRRLPSLTTLLLEA